MELFFKKMLNVAMILAMERKKNGIQIPKKSERNPLTYNKTVPPPSCRVKMKPNVLASFDSSVFSDIYEKRMGKVRNVATPSKDTMRGTIQRRGLMIRKRFMIAIVR